MRIAICDNEEFFCKKAEDTLSEIIDENDVVKCMRFGSELIAQMKKSLFDIVFLGVDMQDMDGIRAAEELQKLNKEIIIIFVSSCTSFVPNAFRINAFQFLLKPVSYEDISYEYFRAVEKYKSGRYIYRINQKSSVSTFLVNDVVYIESMAKHLFLHTKDNIKEAFEYVGKLDKAEKELSRYGFIRTHQSFIVNMKYVKDVYPTFLTLNIADAPRLNVSRNLKSKIRKSFNLYLSGCRM